MNPRPPGTEQVNHQVRVLDSTHRESSAAGEHNGTEGWLERPLMGARILQPLRLALAGRDRTVGDGNGGKPGKNRPSTPGRRWSVINLMGPWARGEWERDWERLKGEARDELWTPIGERIFNLGYAVTGLGGREGVDEVTRLPFWALFLKIFHFKF